MNKKLIAIAAAALATAAFSGGAFATVTTVPDSALVSSGKYYTDIIGGGIGSAVLMSGGGHAANVGQSRNDDGFKGPINLGFTLNFFGHDYTQFWANNNGNISFTGGIAAYTPDGPQGASEPIISPFFADVDTTNSASGLMYLRTDIANEIIVTWDGVGYYDSHSDKLDSFQLVLRGPDYNVPNGEGSIGFFYKDMQWETGDVSGGVPAAIGFGNGSGDGEILQGSTDAGIASTVSNHYIWFDKNLTPVPPTNNVPEPSELPLMLLGLLGIGGLFFLRRRRAENN